MKKSRYSESQIIQIIHEGESGVPITDICREHGISRSAYYKWKAKYGGMDIHELKHLRELETENRRLKQMYAELSLDHKILKDIISKKL
jgi:putative transposase